MNSNEITMVAPCGINCGSCGAHMVKENTPGMDRLLAMGAKKESLPCTGCRAVKGNCPLIGGACETYTCIVGKGFDFCYECPEFPCSKLNPAADKSSVLPHNTKVFSLCFIQRHGLAEFLTREPEIKQRYYQGKMEIGKGPQLK